MKREPITDLKEQWIKLFDREELVAFFDFKWAADETNRIHGLCKISEPRKGQAKSNYLSLLFIIDATDEAMEGLISLRIKDIPWADLNNYMAGIDMIVPLPHVSYGTQHYLKEVEIYLARDRRLSRTFIADELYPAMLKIFPCQGSELTFWEELPPEKKHLPIDQALKKTDRSLIDTIVNFFKGTGA